MAEQRTDTINKTLRDQALKAIGRRIRFEDPLIVHEESVTGTQGEPLYLFRVVSAAAGNGPQYSVALDASGTEVDASRVEVPELLIAAPDVLLPFVPPPAITISPSTNHLTLNPGDSLSETLVVTIPKNTSIPKADVYFLADTTGSMGGSIAAVKTGATTIMSSLPGGIDFAFGVGNYRDLPGTNPPFANQLDPTNVTANVTAAINTWSAVGGDDTPEGQLFALAKLGTGVNWRPGARRIVVWFGDAPGHDPICTAISGQPTITEASATAALTSASIAVVAVSVGTPGLDGDPKAGAFSYTAQCGAPGGTAGQGTRIATATGGAFASGITPATIVTTIVNLVTSVVNQIGNVHLQPTGAIVPFIASITPASVGPLPTNVDHTLNFQVTFKGNVPCGADPQVFNGAIDVVVDGVVVAAKQVEITVPPCQPKEVFSYSVKFVCGRQREDNCGPVRPGVYETEINIHNYHDIRVPIDKFVLPVVMAGVAVGREPRYMGRRAKDHIVLPPHTATMDDCCRIQELLYGGGSGAPLTIGFLEIVSPVELAITAVYTATDLKNQSVSLEVEQIEGKKQTRGH